MKNNYDGDIADVFGCLARLGTEGCGLEEQLASVRAALTRGRSEGFLRDDAYLAVILISDEDDCSVYDPSLFDYFDDETRQVMRVHLMFSVPSAFLRSLTNRPSSSIDRLRSDEAALMYSRRPVVS